ncbi:phosphohydrolase [Vibrio sp. SM6]|uniref:Phosphohydrolase n=1 Tax=Vibrio agarilyticus TaxID=2726741 RepID=A0A7X8TNM3_9VIBR|nr:phosphohydrolase [Vibrio agarilyticus]NLS12063.1 phosphohydrolase [Vibrio agarilyticus]
MSSIEIKRERPAVDTLFERYSDVIGDDLPAYRNHVYRDITYAMHFLDNDPQYEPLIETIFVYHDIGLWTNHQLAYLEPSEAHALEDNARFGWGFDPDVLAGAIHWHHKITPYRGKHQTIIEACRKADWIDISQGRIHKGLDKDLITQVELAFPNLGFQKMLMRLAKDYGGSTLGGSIQVTLGIVKW